MMRVVVDTTSLSTDCPSSVKKLKTESGMLMAHVVNFGLQLPLVGYSVAISNKSRIQSYIYSFRPMYGFIGDDRRVTISSKVIA